MPAETTSQKRVRLESLPDRQSPPWRLDRAAKSMGPNLTKIFLPVSKRRLLSDRKSLSLRRIQRIRHSSSYNPPLRPSPAPIAISISTDSSSSAIPTISSCSRLIALDALYGDFGGIGGGAVVEVEFALKNDGE